MALPKLSVMTVSPAAAERVRGLLANAAAGAGLRVSVEKGGCAGMSYKMEIAEPQKGDEVIETDGARVIVDAKAVLYLLGTTMDVKTTQFSSTFVFENPNQTSACGCGESVELKPADPSRVGLASV
ncbi:iron-sulfur cluster assembly accessory protein [Methylocystis sp. WRRC1]|uniref:HesB/IscA family protein n=1 Tax=Methylocystis sp. WRRC1 TaxID=1732014 RepID=UPI001D15110A|nr:iron-sulfur cluster assembly accessory protein [Methylocystis sp. WRRC1]MCC3244027.1 iron-sulfur cluster assembly accessory protein [Methylocystis sp. WRRC1]